MVRVCKLPFVTIIIPTLNRPDQLSFCLGLLTNQTYPQDLYEIIVVDNGSRQDIKMVAEKFSRIRFEVEKKRGPSAARNKGAGLANGEVLAFTDDDCLPERTWLEEGVKCLVGLGMAGIVGGGIRFKFKNPNFPTTIELYDSLHHLRQKDYVEKLQFSATANLFTYKSLWQEVGGFNEDLQSSEDKNFCQEICDKGYPIVYASAALVYHPARTTLFQISAKTARIVKGTYDASKSFPRLRHIIKMVIGDTLLLVSVRLEWHRVEVGNVVARVKYSGLVWVLSWFRIFTEIILWSKSVKDYFKLIND